ncbi:MAG: kelch repeat-containing protein, partial [Acidobacteriota bacterium]
ESEFDGWTSGRRGSVLRVTLRSQGLLLRGLLVTPKGSGRGDAVVYARGGNLQWGKLRFLDVVRMQMLAETGRTVLAIEYRGEAGSEGTPSLASGDIVDVRAAAETLARLPEVDPDRIDVVGLSRGGLVAAWALESPSPFRSAALVSADLDLSDTAERRPGMDQEVYRVSLPGYADDRDAALRSRSPVHHVGALANVPILLMHASDDQRVSASATLDFASSWLEEGRSARLRLFDHGGHSLLTESVALRTAWDDWFHDLQIAAPREPRRGRLLVPRYGLSAASDGRWLYAYGGAPRGSQQLQGTLPEGLVATIERVDPTTLESVYFSNGVARRANHASVVLGESLISCGGRVQQGPKRSRSASCEALNLRSGRLRELPSLPEELRTLGMATSGGSLYVAGGMKLDGTFSRRTYRLSPDQGSWTRLGDMPAAREGELVAVGDEIVALGGYDGTKALRSVFVYETASDIWRREGDLPYDLSAFTAVADGRDIYVFGDYELQSAVHRYTAGKLTLLDLEITPRRHAAAAVAVDRVLILGGNRESYGPSSSVIESFSLERLRAARPRGSL